MLVSRFCLELHPTVLMLSFKLHQRPFNPDLLLVRQYLLFLVLYWHHFRLLLLLRKGLVQYKECTSKMELRLTQFIQLILLFILLFRQRLLQCLLNLLLIGLGPEEGASQIVRKMATMVTDLEFLAAGTAARGKAKDIIA